MSASYTSIFWNGQKKAYDFGIFLFILIFLFSFAGVHFALYPKIPPATVIIKGLGLTAFLLLHIILVIGPLARLNRKFLPILYNRRHLGVTMFIFGLAHGFISTFYYHGLSDENMFRSIFVTNPNYDSTVDFPFQTLGFFALLIFLIMAVSSHDFWLKNLGPKVWKNLHMLVYVAYGLIILHVVLGAVQNDTTPMLFSVTMIGFGLVSGLHLVAGMKEAPDDKKLKNDKGGWMKVCKVSDIPEDRAKMFVIGDERIAVFKYDGKLSAIHNVCKHQGGPLGEGKVIDGCVTCPWHGYQYLPGNGQSPPPFTEKVATYELKLEGGEVWVDPTPKPEGTGVEPVIIS